MESLGIRQQRQDYFLTYSRANVSLFPTRDSFASAVVNAFETTTVAKVLHWVVWLLSNTMMCRLNKKTGSHYHMAVKLSRKTRWETVRSFLDNQFQIQVNFNALPR